MNIYLRVWGNWACFTRPEMKVERVSYPVMTPSAARGLLEAILYKPQFRWRIHRIAVKRPIQFLSFRRNEVKSRLSLRLLFTNSGRGEGANSDAPHRTALAECLLADEDRTQRNTLALRDVEYVIEASMALTPLANHRPQRKEAKDARTRDSLAKYGAMFERRAEKGQCFVQPCFGCREFPASFELVEPSAMRVIPNLNEDCDLGLMLYDVFDLDIFSEETPAKHQTSRPRVSFFRSELKDGIVIVPAWSQIKKSLEVGSL